MQALFLNTPQLIAQHWPDVGRLIEPGIRELVNGEFTTEDLQELVTDRRAFAGLSFDDAGPVLAMVFEFRHYPRKTVLHVMALGGSDLAETAVTFWPQFLLWAKESGASQIQACASPAITRVLRNIGFGHVYNLLRCEV